MNRTKPPEPENATERIWLEINYKVSQYNSDDVLARITDQSWDLWNSFHAGGIEKKDEYHKFALGSWQLSQIAKIALTHHIDDSILILTKDILSDWFILLDVEKFFRLNEPLADLNSELLFRREMAPFDKDVAAELARFSLLFGSNPIFDQEDCIATAPWERRIGLPISKVSPVVQILRLVATNDFRSIYPLNFDKVRGAIPPIERWLNSECGDIPKYRDDFEIITTDIESFIDKNCLQTDHGTTGPNPDPYFLNPLLAKPFVRLANGTLLVPIIPFLHNVATEGLYYRWLDDPDYGMDGIVHRNGIQDALGTRFAIYSREQLNITEATAVACWTDHCSCPRTHDGEGADFVLYPREDDDEEPYDLIIETKSKRFTSSFLSTLLSNRPRKLTPSEHAKLIDVLGYAVNQINKRASEKPKNRTLGLIVYLSPLNGANTLLNNEIHRVAFNLPEPIVPTYIISSRDLELVLSMKDFKMIFAFLKTIAQDGIWRKEEFLDGLNHHSGAHFTHTANNICSGIHECQHPSPCEEKFPCLYLADNPVLISEMQKLHLPIISN